MLKTMLFSGPSGSGGGSWVLDFGDGTIGTLCNIYISKKGTLYTGGSVYRHISDKDSVLTDFFIEVSAEGEILWQNYFKHNSNNSASTAGCITTIGNNIVVGGQESSIAGAEKDTQLGLYSANGDELATTGITASKVLEVTTPALISGLSSNDNNIYVSGKNYIAKLAKDLSNAYWIKPLLDKTVVNVKCDPDSDYTYFCGNTPPSNNSSSSVFCVGSLSDTGEQRWVEKINSNQGIDVCVTSDGVYACGNLMDYDNKISNGILVKYTKSGSLSWIKEIVIDNAYLTTYTISSDIVGNIYIGCVAYIYGVLAKVSSDGAILSNIKITPSSTHISSTVCYIYFIKVDTRGNVYLWVNNPNTHYLVKLTKNDIKQIATTPLTIGPLIFENSSFIKTISSSITTNSYSRGIINTSSSATKFSLTSSTFASAEANLTPELYYKG